MHAYEVGDYATTGRLRRVKRPDAAPGAGEIRIRVRATGPNARDFAIMRDGIWQGAAPPTRVPLSDVAGEVVTLGPAVQGFAPGDRVTMTHYWRWLDGAWDVTMREDDFGQTRDGFLREYAVVPAAALVAIPDSMSFEEAATLPSAGLTAWQAVVVSGRAGPGDTVVTIGTGGVSVFAMQWAKLMGARVIVTSSSDAKLARMRALGADATINYRTTARWYEAVLALTGGRGANVIVNNVGMAELDQCLEASASGARIMFIGASPVTADRRMTTPEPLRRLGLLIIRDLTLRGVVVGSRRMLADMIAAMTAAGVRPVIDRTYAFDQANEALAYFASADKLGKVVIRLP